MTPRTHGRQGIIDENLEYEAVTGMHIHFERHAVTYFEKKDRTTTAKRNEHTGNYLHQYLCKRNAFYAQQKKNFWQLHALVALFHGMHSLSKSSLYIFLATSTLHPK
jgi:hypothetical protein